MSEDNFENSQASNKIVVNPGLGIWEALIPVFALIIMLAYNVWVFGDNAISGSNQFILLLGASVAAIVGFAKKISYQQMVAEVAENIKSTTEAILILLLVGALAGTWMISGVIPSMIYYGLQILSPGIFLPATLIICSVISVATGSSWTTTATVGIALMGIGEAIGIPLGITAGAVISGAYFGDKISPLSDTTNLAPVMAGTDLFTHIRYLLITTVPSFTITFIAFIFIGLNHKASGSTNTGDFLNVLNQTYNITPLLFIVPAVVIALIILKTRPLIALMVGALLGAVFALIFQIDIVHSVSGISETGIKSSYMGVLNALTVSTSVETPDERLNELLSSGGMSGMLGTIWLIITALTFGGVMDAIGALNKISSTLLSMAKSVFGLFASTVASCLALNITASDQYLAIVVPGKMFKKAYEEKGLAPENLSRTLEDAGTVTSVLIPWNTCGAYQSGVLGVHPAEYFVYAIFNWVSPLMTLFVAAIGFKIRTLVQK